MEKKKRGTKLKEKSVVVLLECLVGEKITVEYKNDLVITGILDSVDKYMNMFLGKAEQYWMEGRQKGQRGPDMELVFLTSKMIRYVHIPSRVNIDARLNAYNQRRRRNVYKRNILKK